MQKPKLKNWTVLLKLKSKTPMSEFKENSRHVCSQNRKKNRYLYWYNIFCNKFAKILIFNAWNRQIIGKIAINKQKIVRFGPELRKNKLFVNPKELSLSVTEIPWEGSMIYWKAFGIIVFGVICWRKSLRTELISIWYKPIYE